ncbi:MAG: hypothetical protein V4538_03510 [Bacteroidota bacterium]
MKHEGYSKLIHVIVFTTFFLPFFQNGCGPSAEEKVKAENKRLADSIAKITAIQDSIALQKNEPVASEEIDSIIIDSNIVSKSNNTTTEKEKRISVQVAEQIPLLKPFLNPTEDISTGVGTIIDSLPYFAFVCTFLCLLLLLISFVIKFIDKKALNTIIFTELLSIVALYNAVPITLFGENLWGYWFCFYAIIALVVFDIYVRIKNKKTE